MSKEINRRMFIGLAAGTIAATASGIPESSAKGAIPSVDESLFYKVVIKLCEAINKLQVASRGSFCPKYGSYGYIVVPEDQKWMLDEKNVYWTSVSAFCQMCWPRLYITDANGLMDGIMHRGLRTEPIPSDTWAIIDVQGYRNRLSSRMEDSIVLFKI